MLLLSRRRGGGERKEDLSQTIEEWNPQRSGKRREGRKEGGGKGKGEGKACFCSGGEQFKGREDSSGAGGGGEEGEIAFRGGFPLLSPHAEGSLKSAEKKGGERGKGAFFLWSRLLHFSKRWGETGQTQRQIFSYDVATKRCRRKLHSTARYWLPPNPTRFPLIHVTRSSGNR